MSVTSKNPDWLLHPLPANAVVDDNLNAAVAKIAERFGAEEISNMPVVFIGLRRSLDAARPLATYEPAVNGIAADVWSAVGPICDSTHRTAKMQLVEFAADHMTPEALGRVCRRLAKDTDPAVRRAVARVIRSGRVREVALPATRDGSWSPEGWLKGTTDVDLSRHKVGKKVQEGHGVPPVATLGQLRELLDIRSPRQLGYFLLASDHKGGPYTTFTIPKRDGGEREICAPKTQLKWVQRRIHEKILRVVPAHDSAHGFITGRSVVTNAAAHVGAAVVVKFDLTDFFPTVHYYRVLGLFASLGYAVGDGRFGTEDGSKQVAPVLARLCCYTPDPKAWGKSHMPQGAPTSPAVSNLVCRQLDSRLTGLAKKLSGTYTRYADDLTFSFKKADVDLGRFRWWVDQVCQQEGFLVNQSKFRVIRRSQRQLVTGVVVNDSVRVPRDARRRFRAILHNCQKTSVAAQARGNPRFAEYLRGFASYLHMVHPEDGEDALTLVAELLGGKDGAE